MGLTTLLLQTRTGFEGIVLRYRHRVFGYAYHMLGDTDEAADATQEVFIRLWERRREVNQERVLPWLMFVTRNACIDVLRHRRTVRSVVTRSNEAIDAVAAGGDLPDASTERSEFRRQIEDLLETLSEPYRSIVILREIQELSYTDICRVMDLPLNTVKVYLHRGRRALRKAMMEVNEGEIAS